MASNNNKLPKGTTHIVMTHDAAFPASRAVDGWCLQNHNGEWVYCGEQVSGYKVDVASGILWEDPKVDVSGPINTAKPGKRIPVKFSCAVMQYATTTVTMCLHSLVRGSTVAWQLAWLSSCAISRRLSLLARCHL